MPRRSKRVIAADLFCGAGGSSTGLTNACAKLGRQLELAAVNHWPLAIETHSLNHPKARHFCEPIDSVDPKKAVPEGRLDLLLASPECVHHSNARGGKPVNDQSRASAWCVLRWATALRIDNILIENVPELQSWGPLGSTGRPLKSRKGETFRAFIEALRSLGYRVDWQVLNAANYGDPTTRKRLFIQARRGRQSMVWPQASHSPKGEPTLFGPTKPWQPARAIIDWTFKGTSIFGRKRPLAPNTIARIAAGLRKYGGKAAEPFLVMLCGSNDARSIDRPVPTVTASGQHIGLCEPFVLPPEGYYRGNAPRSVDEPLQTITAGRGGGHLVEPFIISMEHSGANGGQVRSVEQPVVTVTTRGDLRLCEPVIVPVNHGKDARTYPLDRPMPTVTTVDAWALAEPFLVNYHGNGGAHPVGEPLRTVDCNDRYGLVEPLMLDILFRMLTPLELARAMSFPDSYKFAGNREKVVKQVGNAVPCLQAQALCETLLAA